MEELLSKVKEAKTKTEKQELSAQIVSAMPQFLHELGELEQKYMILLRKCIATEGSKSGGELVIAESGLHKEYKQKKRLYDTIKSALPVLDMYTGGG